MSKRHDTRVVRVGEDRVRGQCSCRQRQMQPVATRQEADDWIDGHLREVTKAQAALQKGLNDRQYLAYLRECSEDLLRSPEERELWGRLADEFEPRVKGQKKSYDTGVETEPLFEIEGGT